MALSPDYPIFNGVAPINDPSAVRLAITAPASGSAEYSIGPLRDSEAITTPQTIYVDNRNAGICQIEIVETGHTIQMPAQSQGYFPAFFGDARNIRVSVAGGGNVFIYVLNVYIEPCVWLATAAIGSVTITGQPISVREDRATVCTRSNVSAAAADTLILASNAARDGGSVFNDSASATLYLSLGTGAASLTSFSVAMTPQSYFEIPYAYTGELRGIWSAAVGAARVTEYT